jgi:hypothetical protein
MKWMAKELVYSISGRKDQLRLLEPGNNSRTWNFVYINASGEQKWAVRLGLQMGYMLEHVMRTATAKRDTLASTGGESRLSPEHLAVMSEALSNDPNEFIFNGHDGAPSYVWLTEDQLGSIIDTAKYRA